MKKNSKKLLATLLTVILTALTVSVPAYAQSGTLGTETPSLTAAFADAAGNTVNGNTLETGDYTVSIKLSGMKTVSIFELTAIYTADLTVNSVATLADTNTSFSVGANVNEDNSIIVILASENDDSSAVADGEVMITMQVTVNTPGNFADFFKVQSDPEVTFIEADYGDGFEAAYVLNADGNEETQTQFPYITVDMSPELTVTVNGTVVVSTNETGTAYTKGIGGVNIYVGATINPSTHKLDGGEIVATTAADGTFTATVPAGTTELIFDGPTDDSVTIPRTVTLSSTATVVNDAIIPIVICDYNHDGSINGTDSTLFISKYSEGNVYSDINCDGSCNGTDMTLYGYFIGKTVVYADLQL